MVPKLYLLQCLNWQAIAKVSIPPPEADVPLDEEWVYEEDRKERKLKTMVCLLHIWKLKPCSGMMSELSLCVMRNEKWN